MGSFAAQRVAVRCGAGAVARAGIRCDLVCSGRGAGSMRVGLAPALQVGLGGPGLLVLLDRVGPRLVGLFVRGPVGLTARIVVGFFFAHGLDFLHPDATPAMARAFRPAALKNSSLLSSGRRTPRPACCQNEKQLALEAEHDGRSESL